MLVTELKSAESHMGLVAPRPMFSWRPLRGDPPVLVKSVVVKYFFSGQHTNVSCKVYKYQEVKYFLELKIEVKESLLLVMKAKYVSSMPN